MGTSEVKEGTGKERLVRAAKIVRKLIELFPHAKIALDYSNHWELLVAVELSAQCTDVQVNKVTKKLFRKYRTFTDYLNADIKEFEQDIKSTGFYRNKAKNILAAAKMIKEKFGGKIPRSMEEILLLPGVARKTANVVLGNAYRIVEGIAVDTHVKRLSKKLGLTDNTDPVKIERDLMRLLAQEEWFAFPYRMQTYGRQICFARKHECREHPLTKIYPRAAENWP